MRPFLFLAGLALLASTVSAAPPYVQTRTLASNLDIEGRAATTSSIVANVNLVNDVALTIAAQPDVCRALQVKVVDTTPSITVGIVTVVGVNCNHAAATEVVSFTGAATTPTVGLWISITSITPSTFATLGGAGDEKIEVGEAGLTWSAAVFPVYLGQDGKVWGSPYQGRAKVDTSGSSTTITAHVAGSLPFQGSVAGDLIEVRLADGSVVQRRIVTHTSDDSVVVDSALTASESPFVWFKKYVGSGAEDGWVSAREWDSLTFQLDIDQMNGTGGIDYVVECRIRGLGTLPVRAFTLVNVSAAGTFGHTITGVWDECRLGMAWKTNDDGTDTGSAQEKVNAYVLGTQK